MIKYYQNCLLLLLHANTFFFGLTLVTLSSIILSKTGNNSIGSVLTFALLLLLNAQTLHHAAALFELTSFAFNLFPFSFDLTPLLFKQNPLLVTPHSFIVDKTLLIDKTSLLVLAPALLRFLVLEAFFIF